MAEWPARGVGSGMSPTNEHAPRTPVPCTPLTVPGSNVPIAEFQLPTQSPVPLFVMDTVQTELLPDAIGDEHEVWTELRPLRSQF